MAEKRVPEHSHSLQAHEHEHEHHHEHPLPEHRHEAHHEHRAMTEAMLRVFEVGPVNSEQLKAIRAVRVALGDPHANLCPHERHAFEGEEDAEQLICQDCRQVLDPKQYIA